MLLLCVCVCVIYIIHTISPNDTLCADITHMFDRIESIVPFWQHIAACAYVFRHNINGYQQRRIKCRTQIGILVYEHPCVLLTDCYYY